MLQAGWERCCFLSHFHPLLWHPGGPSLHEVSQVGKDKRLYLDATHSEVKCFLFSKQKEMLMLNSQTEVYKLMIAWHWGKKGYRHFNNERRLNCYQVLQPLGCKNKSKPNNTYNIRRFSNIALEWCPEDTSSDIFNLEILQVSELQCTNSRCL